MSDARAQQRVRLSDATDARAVQTRERLHEAFRSAARQQVPDLNVMKLAQLAGVGRSTFYTHYATIEELAVSVIDALFREVALVDADLRTRRALPRPEITRLGLEQLVGHLWDGRELLLYARGLPTGDVVNDLFVQALSESTRDVVRAERADLDEAGVRIASDFLGAGTARVVVDWLEHPGETSREHVIDVLFIMLPTWLTQDDAGTR